MPRVLLMHRPCPIRPALPLSLKLIAKQALLMDWYLPLRNGSHTLLDALSQSAGWPSPTAVEATPGKQRKDLGSGGIPPPSPTHKVHIAALVLA